MKSGESYRGFWQPSQVDPSSDAYHGVSMSVQSFRHRSLSRIVKYEPERPTLPTPHFGDSVPHLTSGRTSSTRDGALFHRNDRQHALRDRHHGTRRRAQFRDTQGASSEFRSRFS